MFYKHYIIEYHRKGYGGYYAYFKYNYNKKFINKNLIYEFLFNYSFEYYKYHPQSKNYFLKFLEIKIRKQNKYIYLTTICKNIE